MNFDSKGAYPAERSVEALAGAVQQSVEALRKQNLYAQGLGRAEADRLQAKKERLFTALDDCIYGSLPDKEFVKEYVRDIMIEQCGLRPEDYDAFIPFDRDPHLTIQDRFEIIMHVLWKRDRSGALSRMIRAYGLDRLREENGVQGFHIDEDDILRVYRDMRIVLEPEDRLQILVQRVYAEYRGYRSIDRLLDMSVDGISLGVSGLSEDLARAVPGEIRRNGSTLRGGESAARACDAVWIFFAGKSIQLRFLSLGSFAELKRVCSTIFKYGHPGEISKSVGYRINRLKDGSRCVVVRPDFAETWACFIRKFDLPDVRLESLLQGEDSEKAVEMVKHLVKGARNIAVTGSQGSGKTTLMKSMIEHIHGTHPLRILEMAFELHVRKTQPNRNILTVRETEDISGQRGLDLLKKTDGAVTIVGEVATDPVAAYMIQTAQTASLFTIFSHHAKTFPDLVMELRNSLLKQEIFRSERVAEEQVVRVLDIDIHLERDLEGNRYVSRITECIPSFFDEDAADEMPGLNLQEIGPEHAEDPEMRMARLLFYRSGAGMRTYRHRNLIEYDVRRKCYCMKDRPTDRLVGEMQRAMTVSDRERFDAFLEKEYGPCRTK